MQICDIRVRGVRNLLSVYQIIAKLQFKHRTNSATHSITIIFFDGGRGKLIMDVSQISVKIFSVFTLPRNLCVGSVYQLESSTSTKEVNIFINYNIWFSLLVYLIPDPPYGRGPYPVPADAYQQYPYTHPRYVLERNSYPSDDFQFFYY